MSCLFRNNMTDIVRNHLKNKFTDTAISWEFSCLWLNWAATMSLYSVLWNYSNEHNLKLFAHNIQKRLMGSFFRFFKFGLRSFIFWKKSFMERMFFTLLGGCLCHNKYVVWAKSPGNLPCLIHAYNVKLKYLQKAPPSEAKNGPQIIILRKIHQCGKTEILGQSLLGLGISKAEFQTAICSWGHKRIHH